MPIKIQDALPAREILDNENIFVMTEYRAMHQDIRPLNVLMLNLMPTKIVTETQFLRKLSNTPLQVEVEFLHMASHVSTHVDQTHLNTFYQVLKQIMEWTKTHVHCTLHSCWGSFAGLYYHYGIQKRDHVPKLSGIYSHRMIKKNSPLFRGFDDVFYAPHSRATEITAEQIEAVPELEIMAVSEEAGVAIAKTVDSRQFFITCHPEYDSDTLKLEYERDLEKGMNPLVPVNYFPNDDPSKAPIVNWRSTGQLLLSNWLNYYVYQSTPYKL